MDKEKQVPAARFVSAGHVLCAFTWKLVLAGVVVYGLLQVMVRMDFFQSQVEKELSQLAGMEMRVGRIRATESLNLRIRDAIGVSSVAGIEARIARIRWRLFRPRGEPMLQSVRVDGLALTIAPDETGAIQPAFLARWSKNVFEWAGMPLPKEWTGTEEMESASAAGGKGAADPPLETWIHGPLVFQDVSVRWQDAQGNLKASVSGLDVVWTSMITPRGRRVSHLECRAAEIKVLNGPKLADVRLELVEADGKRFLVRLDAADWGGVPAPKSPDAEARELLDAMDRPAN